MANTNALIIFAKAPVAGQVKTRLQTHLSAEECAGLHAYFIIKTIEIAKKVNDVSIFLYCHPGVDDPFFKKVESDLNVKLMSQNGNDLGERMSDAIRKTLSAGYRKVVIIGSDSPDLPPEYINEGFEKLDSSDMVIGPSTDGGYYLIGAKKELPIFNNIPWSSYMVFDMTIEKAGENNLTFSILGEWYDIDTWEDLRKLWKCQT